MATARPFLRRGPSGPLAEDEPPPPPDAGCEPRFHEIFVDWNTEIEPEDRNGSLCFPFGSINEALSTIPPLQTPFKDFPPDQQMPVEINCAPGVYDEDVTLGGSGNLQGRNITLRCVAGALRSTAAIGLLGQPGQGLFLADPLGVVGRVLTLDYTGLDGLSEAGSRPPSYVFENLAIETVDIFGSEEDPVLTESTSTTWMDCLVTEMLGKESEEKFRGYVEIRNTQIDMVSAGEMRFDCEHSVGVTWEFVRKVRSAKCLFDEILIDPLVGLNPIEEAIDLTDTMITTQFDEFVGGPGRELRLDAATASMCELFGSMSPTQGRLTQDLTGQAYQHLTGEPTPAFGTSVFLDNAVSTAIFSPPVLWTVSLPPLTNEGWQKTGVNGRMSRQLVLKVRAGVAGSANFVGSGGDTIEGAATLGPLAAGEGVILVARTSSDWEVIATVP